MGTTNRIALWDGEERKSVSDKCEICGRGPKTGEEKVAIFKVDGRWLCWQHMTVTQRDWSDARWLKRRKIEWQAIKAHVENMEKARKN